MEELLLLNNIETADEILIEFPAGKIEQNEDPLNCAKRNYLKKQVTKLILLQS